MCSFTIAFLLSGCDNATDDFREQVSCTVILDVNLPENASVLDTGEFNPFEPLTYTSSTTTTFFDISGQSYLLSAYFVKTDQPLNTWDVYFSYDDLPINIESGAIGGNSQLSAQLQFDELGQLNATAPDSITSEQLILNDDTFFHSINFVFSKFVTTQLDLPFTVLVFQNTCLI